MICLHLERAFYPFQMIEPHHFDEKLAGGGSGPTICCASPQQEIQSISYGRRRAKGQKGFCLCAPKSFHRKAKRPPMRKLPVAIDGNTRSRLSCSRLVRKTAEP